MTLSPKNEFHSKNSSRMPELNNPMTAPPPATPTHMPTAAARSSGGKDVVITDRVTGMMAAAPTPMQARTTIRTWGSLTNRPNAEATPKMTRPASRTGLRPIRSPRAPTASSSPAKTRV